MRQHQANLHEQLHDLEQRRQGHGTEGMVLVQRWAQAFPRGTIPFRLVRLYGESNTLLRWRSSGKAWPVRGGRFELAAMQGQFLQLPDTVRARVLDFEQSRTRINYDYAITAYLAQRARALSEQRQALAELRRLHRAKLTQGNPPDSR